MLKIERGDSKTVNQTHNKIVRCITVSVLMICAVILLASPTIAEGDISQNVTINQIENHSVGDTFEITGFCKDKDPSLYVMVHPTKNYIEIKNWVLEAKDPQFSFGIECDGTEEGSPGNITRFFPNGTSESKIIPMPINRIYPEATVLPESNGSSWKTTINGTNFLGEPLKPDTYSITVLAVGKGDDMFVGAADASFTLS